MRSELNANKWRDHVQAWKNGTITQSEYCRINKLSTTSFSTWKLKFARQPQETIVTSETDIPVFTSSSTPQQLVPVAISETVEPTILNKLNPESSGVTLIFKEVYKISINKGFHTDTLKSVLQILAE